MMTQLHVSLVSGRCVIAICSGSCPILWLSDPPQQLLELHSLHLSSLNIASALMPQEFIWLWVHLFLVHHVTFNDLSISLDSPELNFIQSCHFYPRTSFAFLTSTLCFSSLLKYSNFRAYLGLLDQFNQCFSAVAAACPNHRKVLWIFNVYPYLGNHQVAMFLLPWFTCYTQAACLRHCTYFFIL